MIDLEELAALESKATPAPWHRVPANKAETPFVLAHGEGDSIASFEPCGPWVSGKQAIDDLDLTVALRNAAPELIASARRVVELEKDKRELIELAQKRFEQVAALQSRLAAAEAEREAMQLEIDQGREAREMMNDSIDALQSRLSAAEEIVELFRAQNPNSPDGACECGTCDALRVYARTAGATDADGGGRGT